METIAPPALPAFECRAIQDTHDTTSTEAKAVVPPIKRIDGGTIFIPKQECKLVITYAPTRPDLPTLSVPEHCDYPDLAIAIALAAFIRKAAGDLPL
jgi:hypothetical protein